MSMQASAYLGDHKMAYGLIGIRAAFNPIVTGGGGTSTVLVDAVSSGNDIDGLGNPSGVVQFTHTPVSSNPSGAIGMLAYFNGEYNTILNSAKYGAVNFVENISFQGPVGSNIDHGAGAGIEQGNYWKAHLFGLPNPPTGAQVVQFQFSGLDIYAIAGCLTVTGSDLVNIFRSIGVSSSGTGLPSLVIPTASGDLVIDVVTGGQQYTGSSLDGKQVTDWPVTGPNTRRWIQAPSAYGNTFAGAGSTAPAGGSSVTTGWGKTGNATAYWLACGASIKAATAPVATLNLSSNTILDNAASNTVIGTLSVSSGVGTYTYSLTSNPGNLFNISGSSLRVNATLTAGSDPITVQADNGAGSVITQAFTIVVSAASSGGVTGWNRLKVGGGGFVMQVGISNDGVTKVISTDSGGALVSTSGGDWFQVIDHNIHMPTNEFDQTNSSRMDGSYSMAVAPSDHNRIYLFCKGNAGLGYVYRSNDGGTTFARTNFRGIYGVDSNGAYRQYGPKMAVDPANPDVVFMSSHSNPGGSGIQDGNFASATAGTPGVVNMQNNFFAGQAVSFNSYGGTSPGGTTIGTVYYVSSSGLSNSSFRVSDTAAHGIAGTNHITFTTAGSNLLVADQASYYTTDGFVTSQPIPNLPQAGLKGPDLGICFDPTSSVVSGRTQGIFLFSQNNGLYKSTSYTGTVPNFAPVGGSGAPVGAVRGKCSFDGVYYTCNAYSPTAGLAGQVKRLQSGTWTDLTSIYSAVQGSPDPSGIACDPTVAGKVYFMQGVAFGGGRLIVGTAYGNTMVMKPPVRATGTGQPAWLDNSVDTFAIGDITCDPSVSGKIWLATGMGVRFTLDTSGSTVTWTSASSGIEELVWGRIVSPPGKKIIACCYDRGIFQLDTSGVYPTHQTFDETKDAPDGIAHSCDWASSDPATQAVVLYSGGGNSGKSTTGGGYGTWSGFSGRPSPDPAGTNGSIACSSPNCMIYVAGGGGGVFYTRDGGAHWTLITQAMWNASGSYGNPTTFNGFSNYYYLYRQSIAADRTLVDTYYIQNWLDSATGGGIYKITFPSGVLNIVRMDSSGTFNSPGLGLFNVLMECPIGYGGYCFITAGQDQSGTSGLQWTDNQFTNLYKVANIGEVYAFSFGLAKPGNNFPSIYVVGYKSGVYGIWRGDGNLTDWQAGSKTGTSVTWTNLGGFPLGSAALIQTIAGDNNTYGWCYTGSNVNGIHYYKP